MSHLSGRLDMLGLAKDREELTPEPILKQGMVLKRGRKITSQWKKRYFVLRPTTLSYHAGPDTDQAERRYIEITQNSTVTHRPDKHPLAFQVRTPGFRKITARCESDEDLHFWMSAIDECIKRAPAWPVKCVVVGDDEEATFGKRVMVMRYFEACRGKMEDGEAKMLNSHAGYTLNKTRTRIVKTPDELGNVDILLEYETGEWVKLMLWYLDGREEATNLRALAYPHSDIFIVVFSVSDSKSFEKVDSYLKEIKSVVKATPNAPNPIYLLVGTRLSSELVSIGFNQGEAKARTLGFSGYVECRIDSEEDCQQVFTDAVRLVVEKSVVVYSSAEINDQHMRQASGILSSLASRLRKKATAEVEDGAAGGSRTPTNPLSQADSDSSDVSPSSGKRKGFGFFSASEKLANAAISPKQSASSVKRSDHSDLTKGGASIQSSQVDADDDSDEGSVIGVEVEETEEEAKARSEKDFGLSDMKDDIIYTHKVLSRTNSRRSGEQNGQSHRSLGTASTQDKELFDIAETAAEDRERELDELREKDAKRARELERMKAMMDSLKTHNKTIEDQLRAMREELAVVNKKGGAVLGLAAPLPPPLAVKSKDAFALPPAALPSSVQPAKTSPNASGLEALPPRAPMLGADRSPASKASFRSSRAASVFF